MELGKSLPYVVGLVLLLVLGYLALPYLQAPPVKPVKDTALEELYVRSLEFGKGQQNYLYSYEETIAGYPEIGRAHV